MVVKSKKPVPKRLPKASKLAETELRPDLDHIRTNERLTQLGAHIADHGQRIAQVEGSADYWAGVSQRVKKLEEEKSTPPTTIVEQASGMSIAWCFLVHDLIVGAMIGGGWFYWQSFGPHLPPGWGH